MSDHIRTALYGAKYQALLVNRHEEADETVTIAGKLCESGDIIIRDALLLLFNVVITYNFIYRSISLLNGF